MSEGMDGFAGALPEEASGQDSQQQLKTCDWKNCKGKHREPPKYPNDGNFTRSGALPTSLTEDQKPWNKGPRNRPTRPIYVEESGSGRITIREQAAWEQSGSIWYYTEAHHLIPVKLMKKLSTLPHNAKLVSWNIDGAKNGLFLPGFPQDIAIHGLQVHEGNHPGATYMTPIHTLLKSLEQQFEDRCDGKEGDEDISAQQVLATNLEVISNRARRKILEIATNPAACWQLHDDSVVKYNDSFTRYQRVERLYQEQHRAKRPVLQLRPPPGST